MGVEALQSAKPQPQASASSADLQVAATPVLDGLGALSTAYDTVSQRLKLDSAAGWRSFSSSANRIAGGVLASASGFQRVFSALDRDIKDNSTLYSRTALAIPVSVLQITAAAEVAALTAAGVAAAGFGTGVAAAAVVGAAALGTAYGVSQAIDFAERKISSWLHP